MILFGYIEKNQKSILDNLLEVTVVSLKVGSLDDFYWSPVLYFQLHR